MNLPENQPTALPKWAEHIRKDMLAVGIAPDTLPLVPVAGKKPLGQGWQHTSNISLQDIVATSGATGVGLRLGRSTGHVPHFGAGLVCFDFDGLSSMQWAMDNSGGACDFHQVKTWKIRRVDNQGQPILDRVKVLFRLTEDQAAYFYEHGTTDKNGEQRGAQWTVNTTKGEGLQVFSAEGRQVVIAGAYHRTDKATKTTEPFGCYLWDKGERLSDLADCPDAWFKLATKAGHAHRDKHAAAKAGASAGVRAIPSGHGAPEPDDWIGVTERHAPDACPICSRDTTSACQWSPSSGSVWCFNGQTFGPPTLKAGDRLPSDPTYAFVRTATFNGDPFGGAHSLFRVHRDRSETVSIPADPQPWAVASEVSITPWDTAAGLSEAEPASEQTVDVTTGPVAVEGDKTPETTKAKAKQLRGDYIDGRYDDEQAVELLKQLASDAGRLEARAGQSNTLANEVKLELGLELVGPANSVAPMAASIWQSLVKAARAGELVKIADEQKLEALTRYQRTLALARAQNPALAPVLEALGPGAGDAMDNIQVHRLLDPMPWRWNVLTRHVELECADGNVYDVDDNHLARFYMVLAAAGHQAQPKPVSDAIWLSANRNHYNPIAAYLNTLRNDDTVEPFALERVATEILGVQTELEVEMVKRWLIACVARGMRPGCKADSMLVLFGRQGQGKSTFGKHLVPNPSWFNDSRPDNDKDWLIGMHRSWITEVPELDAVTSKKDSSKLKALQSIGTDNIRPVWAPGDIATPRHFVMLGTTNDRSLLRDETGSRRFMVVDTRSSPIIGSEAMQQALEPIRDGIWRAALHAFEGGERWWLDAEQEQLLQESNVDYEPENPVHLALAEFTATRRDGSWGSLSDILKASGELTGDILKAPQSMTRPAGAALQKLEWHTEKQRVGRGGRPVNIWVLGPTLHGKPDPALRVRADSGNHWPGGW